MQTTITIDASKRINFEKRVAQLQRKAERLGFEPISIVSMGQPYEQVVNVEINVGPGEWESERRLVSMIDIEIAGMLPKFDGWQVQACIDHTDEGNIALGVVDMDADTLAALQPDCDHCGHDRNRIRTFIIAKDDQTMQVGGTCLKDFTRNPNPAAAFFYGADLAAFMSDIDAWQSHSHGVKGIDVTTLLAIALGLVQRFGYVSRKSSEYMGASPTADDAMAGAEAVNNGDKQYREIYDENLAAAEQIIDWVTEQDTESSYIFSCQTIIRNGIVSNKYAGIIVSLVPSYRRHIERQIREAFEATAINEHVGEVKDRLRNLNLTVQMIREFEGMYGVTTMLILRDEQGRTYKWMASGYQSVEQGDTIVLDGTVKEHAEYNDTKQTILTRCKIK